MKTTNKKRRPVTPEDLKPGFQFRVSCNNLVFEVAEAPDAHGTFLVNPVMNENGVKGTSHATNARHCHGWLCERTEPEVSSYAAFMDSLTAWEREE